MKTDDGDARARLESRNQNAQSFLQRAELIVHFHAQGLKNLRGRMSTPMSTDNFLNRARQHERFAEWRFLARLHDNTRDATRGRFLTQIAEQLCELFVAVIVD